MDRRYSPLHPIAQGGMASVQLAMLSGPEGFEKLAVLKCPHGSPDSNASADWFKEEARIAAALNHPNIIHTYEVFYQEGRPVLAMEYVEGLSLREWMPKGPLKPSLLVHYLTVVIEVLKALEYLHSLNDFDGDLHPVIHCDISPTNVLVGFDGRVKVLDFGIAKRIGGKAEETTSGLIRGKVAYMAPEQARGGTVDERTDLYAVGAILWEAIAGRSRRGDRSEGAMLQYLVEHHNPVSPGAAELGLPAELDSIIETALSVQPEKRFQSAATLREQLELVRRQIAGQHGAIEDPVTALGQVTSDRFAKAQRLSLERIKKAIAEWREQRDGPPSSSMSSPSPVLLKRAAESRLPRWAAVGGTMLAVCGVALAQMTTDEAELVALPVEEPLSDKTETKSAPGESEPVFGDRQFAVAKPGRAQSAASAKQSPDAAPHGPNRQMRNEGDIAPAGSVQRAVVGDVTGGGMTSPQEVNQPKAGRLESTAKLATGAPPVALQPSSASPPTNPEPELRTQQDGPSESSSGRPRSLPNPPAAARANHPVLQRRVAPSSAQAAAPKQRPRKVQQTASRAPASAEHRRLSNDPRLFERR